jgi:hypothetical protein
MAGHAQSLGSGADVFLANPRGQYLGRTCHWRECRPGIRARCDALHCGRRPYLHDDLQTVTLHKELVIAPPVELWPRIVARRPLPHNIKQVLSILSRDGSK